MESDQITAGTPIKKPVPISTAPFGGLDDDDTPASGNSGTSASSTPSVRSPIKLSRENLNAKADDLAKQLELPKRPGEVVQDVEVIQKWFDMLSAEHWNKLMVYVNRIYPVINRKIKNPDENKYIDVISKDTYESAGNKSIYRYLSNQHGGGKYQLYVNDVSKKGNQTLFIGYVIVPTDEVAPKINLDELDVYHKTNAGFIVGLQNQGIMDSNKKFIDPKGNNNNNQTPTTTQSNGSGSDTAAVMAQVGAMYKDMMTILAKANERDRGELNKGGLNDLFLEKLKQEDPNKQVAMLSTMLTALQGLIPKPVAPDTSNQISIKDILQMQQGSHDKMLEMMGKLMEGRNDKQEDDLERLARYKQVLPELFGGRGKSGEDREKTTGELIYEGVKELGLPILGIVSQMFQAKTGAAPIIPVTVGQAQAMIPGPATSNVIPMPAPQGQQTPQQNNSSAQPQEQVMPENLSPIVVKYIQAYGMVIINAIKAKQTGVDVGQSISDMTSMLGEDVYTILKNQGKDKILSTMKAIPEFWNQTGGVYGEAHMVQFVEEFINFEEILDKEDGEEGGNDNGVTPIA